MVAEKLAPITKLVLVTDPMCSWCWGQVQDFEQARQTLQHKLTFDLMLGGINTHGTQPIGQYGRRLLHKLWTEVATTTGQPFGQLFSSEYVHNSLLPCLAVQALTDFQERPAFEYLHQLQKMFFVGGVNINDQAVLVHAATAYNITQSEMVARMADPNLLAKVKFQFDNATQYGTQALPSLLVARQGSDNELTLFSGGYVDANMLTKLLKAQLV